MSKKYTVKIRKVEQYTYNIEAENEEEAEKIAVDRHDEGNLEDDYFEYGGETDVE